MRKMLFIGFLNISITSYGQTSKWQLSIELRPELTLHKERYRPWAEDESRSTANIGFASLAHYSITKRVFVNGGVNFISRKLRTANHLMQSALPPPRQSFTQELVTTESESFRVLSFPINIGYRLFYYDRFASFITTGFSGNYLLNTYYKAHSSPYDGAYKKNYWQGYSLLVGLGTDYKLSKTILATAALSYPIVNKVKEDEYIYNRDGGGLTLYHKYMNLNLGIKFPL